MVKFDIISLFPEFFYSPLSCGIVKIAQEKAIIEISITNPRDFSKNRVVDDYQFGGGAGMVMKPEPLTKATKHVQRKNSFIVNLTPQGRRLNQDIVTQLTKKRHIIIICGRYKGIDERINSIFKPLEVSLGDYVLSGGETGALLLIEAITRLLPGSLGNKDSAETDSFQNHLLAAPLYTRPNVYKRLRVPPLLRSGDHRLINRWRRKETLNRTLSQRPELLTLEVFTKTDFEILLEVLDGENS
jgi:tRNA (guanine37-N1)-methyltransferase